MRGYFCWAWNAALNRHCLAQQRFLECAGGPANPEYRFTLREGSNAEPRAPTADFDVDPLSCALWHGVPITKVPG